MSTPQFPPPLFEWQVEPWGQAQEGVCGVTDDRHRACEHVYDELLSAPPGTRAAVHRVAVDVRGDYQVCGESSTAWHDPALGGVVWMEG